MYGTARLGMWLPNMEIATGASSEAEWGMLGKKQYELTNHLGNVLATISDRRLQHSSNGTTIDYYDPDIITAQDYYDFGSLRPGL